MLEIKFSNEIVSSDGREVNVEVSRFNNLGEPGAFGASPFVSGDPSFVIFTTDSSEQLLAIDFNIFFNENDEESSPDKALLKINLNRPVLSTETVTYSASEGLITEDAGVGNNIISNSVSDKLIENNSNVGSGNASEPIEKIQNFLIEYNQLIQTRDDLAAQLQSIQNSIDLYKQTLNQISNILNNLPQDWNYN